MYQSSDLPQLLKLPIGMFEAHLTLNKFPRTNLKYDRNTFLINGPFQLKQLFVFHGKKWARLIVFLNFGFGDLRQVGKYRVSLRPFKTPFLRDSLEDFQLIQCKRKIRHKVGKILQRIKKSLQCQKITSIIKNARNFVANKI